MIAIDINGKGYTVRKPKKSVKVLDTTLLRFRTGKRAYDYAFVKVLYKKNYMIIQFVSVQSILKGVNGND